MVTLAHSKARARGWIRRFVLVLPVILIFVLAALVGIARADAPATAPVVDSGYPSPAGQPSGAPVVEARQPYPHRVFSLTISPLHLFLPVVELTGEYRALDKLGFALIAGAGKYKYSSYLSNVSAGVFEVGGQLRYYVVGDFRHGMQLGAEVLYLHLTDHQVTVAGEGVAMGPFAGYKIITSIGFTFEGQLGVEYVAARAWARNGAVTASDTDDAWIPLLNLNVGWSF